MSTPRPGSARVFYGWVIVAGAWAMYMLNQAAFTWGFTVFVNPLAHESGWSRTSITLAWALSLSWGLLLGPWFGRRFDRYGPRPLVILGGVAGGLGWLLIPTATSYWTFLLYFVLLVGTGINGALGPSIGSAAIAQWFNVRRSLAMGVYFTGSGGAGLIVIPAVSALVQTYGWRIGAASLGAAALVLTAMVAPFMRHQPEQQGLVPDGGAVARNAAAASRRRDFLRRLPFPRHHAIPDPDVTLPQALRQAAFWLFTCAIFLRYLGMGITQVHQMPHMLTQGLGAAVATAAISLSLVINIPARIAVGWMGDVYSKKWLLNVLAIAGALGLWALAVATPQRTDLVWIYAVLWGIGLGMLPLQTAWLADSYGRRNYGSIASVSNSFALSGRVVGALGAGLAYDLLGDYELVMLLGAAGFALGALLLLFLPPAGPGPARDERAG
jgi:MFS family permease